MTPSAHSNHYTLDDILLHADAAHLDALKQALWELQFTKPMAVGILRTETDRRPNFAFESMMIWSRLFDEHGRV